MKCLDELREILDKIMIKAIGKKIVLYGYGRTGQFLHWYAEYYHNICIDYIVMEDISGIPYTERYFLPSLFEFDIRNVKDATVWLALPNRHKEIEKYGYKKNITYFDFYEEVYGTDYKIPKTDTSDSYNKRRKQGDRDIQLLEWLEYKCGCDFITSVASSCYEINEIGAKNSVGLTQKELFPLLDNIHCRLSEKDSIFDIGCGKGCAMICFLDYGFQKVGGVEYDKKIYDIMTSNFQRINNSGERLKDRVEYFNGNAADLKFEIDGYNWFYMFDIVRDINVYEKIITNICDSAKRNPRKIRLIAINPFFSNILIKYGFVLSNQFCIATRQKIVDIFIK